MRKILLMIFLTMGISQQTFAEECSVTTTFKNKSWRLISLPCDPQGKTVKELFGKAGFGETYDKDWILYTHDTQANTHKKLSINAVMEAGKGYWFKQISGSDKVYTMTGGKVNKNLKIPIDSRGSETWNLLGNPYAYGLKSSNVKWTSEVSNATLTWKEVVAQKLIHTEIWTYKDGKYIKKDMSNPNTTIDPWDGFWVVTLENYSNNPVSLLTTTSANPNLEKKPPIEGNWIVDSELTDEFDNGINTDKWYTKDPDWKGRFPSYFESNNVSVEDGVLKLKSRKVNNQDKPPQTDEGTYIYATAAFKSKKKVKYGYFETKAKASGSGYWNSFWLYDATKTDWTEIDVYEIVASEDYRFSTAHLFYAKPDYEGTVDDHIKEQKEFFDVTDLTEYHVYGLDWNKETITWYIDGELVFSIKNKHWHQELYVMFDAEVAKWPDLPGSTEETYEIKYIRTWKNKN